MASVENLPERSGRLPPQDVDAERSVLGAMLLDEGAASDVLSLIGPDDFYRPAHARIFESMQQLFEKNEPLDEVTVVAQLRATGQLEGVGGATYLATLTQSVPTAANAAHYARIVRDRALSRRLINAATVIAGQGYEGGEIDMLLDEAESKIFEITRAREHRGFTPLKEAVKTAFKQIETLYERKEAITGVPTGFADLDKCTSGFQRSDLIIIAGRPSMGKCLSADAELVLADGSIATMAEVHERKAAELLTLGDDLRLRLTRPSAFVDDGVKPVYRVTTRLGRSIKTTASHPYLTPAGWRPLAELRPGAKVAVPRRLDVFGRERTEPGRVITLAHLIGDGCLTKTCPELTNTNPRVRADFVEALRAFGPLDTAESDSRGTRATTLRVSKSRAALARERIEFARRTRAALQAAAMSQRELARRCGVSPAAVCAWMAGRDVPATRAFELLCSALEVAPSTLAPSGIESIQSSAPNALTLWMRELGLWGRRAQNKVVPPFVQTLCREQLALFLNRLFATDGWACILASGQPQAGYATTSERLARQVQHLLLRFGVIAALRRRSVAYRGTRRPAWQLDINDAASLETLATEIGIFGKEETVEAVLCAVRSRRRQTNRDLVPAEIWQQLALAKGAETWASVARRAGVADSNLHVGTRALSRPRLAALALAIGNAELVRLARSDVYWDEFVSIEPVGHEQVYDLTIPETHNFVANDICVHNTAFALNVGLNAAIRSKTPVAVFSLEMSKEQLVMRMLCSEARIDAQRLRSGFLKESDWPKLAKSAGMLAEAPVYIDDSGAISILEMRAKARRLQADKGLGMIIVDYLQLMRGRSGAEGREREISEISRGLKALAKELGVPVIALSQLNRSLEQRTDKRPMLSDLRESGAIEQDADVICFVYRDEYYDPNSADKGLAEIIVGKQRNGPTDTIKLRFFKEYTRFDSAAPRDGQG